MHLFTRSFINVVMLLLIHPFAPLSVFMSATQQKTLIISNSSFPEGSAHEILIAVISMVVI